MGDLLAVNGMVRAVVARGMVRAVVARGMVRNLAKQNKNIIVVVLWRNRQEARVLFRDMKRVSFYIVYSHTNIAPFFDGRYHGFNRWKIAMLKKLNIDTLLIGNNNPNLPPKTFADENKRGRVMQVMHEAAGFNPNIMHNKFFLARDKKREGDFYRRAISYLKTDDYVVVHDDPKRGFTIDITKIPELKNGKTKILYLGKGHCPIKNKTMFDTITTIERARAFHGFDSSFMWLVELLGLKTKSYLHATPARPHARNAAMVKTFRKKWILIK
ncbi:MAG: hypothetical protein QM529_03215 [Hydrotalea sp.]|nr:hypothetical protein [Hydrotalea sp.]